MALEDYQIIQSASSLSLASEVKAAGTDGWLPLGPPFIANDGVGLMQAMTKGDLTTSDPG